MVKASKKWTLKRRHSNYFTFAVEGDAVEYTTEAYLLIQEVSMSEEEKAHPLNSDDCFDKLHEFHTKEMDSMPDILPSEIDEIDDEIFGMLANDDIDDIMVVER